MDEQRTGISPRSKIARDPPTPPVRRPSSPRPDVYSVECANGLDVGRGDRSPPVLPSVPPAASPGGLEELAVDPERLAVLIDAGRGRTSALRSIWTSTRWTRYSTSARRGRNGRAGHVDMERPAVGEPHPTVGAVLETTDRDPGGAVERQRLVDRALVGPRSVSRLAGLIVRATSPLTTTSIRPSGTRRRPSRRRRYSRAVRAGRLEAVAGVVPVQRDEEHRAGRHEAAARVQAAEPGALVEAPVEPDVDPAEAERHRVDARGRARPSAAAGSRSRAARSSSGSRTRSSRAP